LDETRAKAVISKALELGINLIDTADVYNEGRSEEIIGRAIEGHRSQVLVGTKAGIVTDGGPRVANLSAKYLEKKASESLRRLRTDCIDLFYLHRYDQATPLEESLGAVDRLIRNGKVRYFGVSNFTTEQLERTMETCEARGFAKPVAVQNQYSLLARDAETELIPRSRAKALSFFAYSPLGGGFLTGKYKHGEAPPKGSRGEANRRYWERLEKEGDFGLVERLDGIARGAGITLRELALAWILRNPGVTAPVVGASYPEQVTENCKALDLHLESGLLHELDQALQ